MRKIKLRAKPIDLAHEQFPEIFQKKEKEFVYGTGVYQDSHNTWLILENSDKKPHSQMRSCIVVPKTVGQYADLKDEDEKEIFEDDIVSFAIFDYNGADTQYTGVVKFSDGQWQLWKSADDPYYGSDGPFNMHMVWYNDDGFKVIGNIHESEVTTHENNSNSPHHSPTQPKAEETADEGGLQT